MTKKRILYISSEFFPFTSKSSIIAKKMHFKGNDVRIFMPRYGIINERKHHLHEVIRLSGMKVIIKNIDKPMMIKVASLPAIRLQVYFIENEEFFKRRGIYSDRLGFFFEDNDERMLFFNFRNKKTQLVAWHSSYSWIGSCIPLYIKTYYKGDLLFKNTKIVSSIYNENFEKYLSLDLIKKIRLDGIKNKYLKHIERPYLRNLIKLAIDNSDLIVKEDKYIHSEIEYYINLNYA